MESVGSRIPRRGAVAVVAILVASACSGSKEPPASVPLVPGATQVTGRERLSWEQPDDAAAYTYRAYVDGQPVDSERRHVCRRVRPDLLGALAAAD